MCTMFRTIFLACTGFLVIGTLLSGCSKKSAPAGPPPGGPPEVSVITIEPQRITLTSELSGRVSASQTAEVRPQVGGIIKKQLFREGSDVAAGTVLYQIDPSSYQASFNGAKAALAKAEANLAPTRLKSERYRELVKINAVSKQDYDDISAAMKLAEAEIESAKAALESARINLAYTKVTAPISGRIGRSSVTNGALVTAGQGAPLATIQQLSPVNVDVTQSSSDMLRLKKALDSGQLSHKGGQAQVKLLLEDGTPYPLSGTLKLTEAFVDPGTGSVTLRVLFPNPKQLLLPGMFVRAILEEGVKDQAILVPQRGVTRNPAGNAMVMVVGTDEKVAPQVIKAERTVGNSWLVSDGLKTGDRVILEGLQKARPGTVVKAVPFGSKPAATAPPTAKAEKK
ncbi:MAG: efflux RND transporter periplasmic adaptor subunit [Desulfuromonadaceae bacterium]|nr:efflux RND transporter periplasmic adaptor subunit [Desulfuromonadaceae bacterium]MDD5106473.1 efflux RND transporter periplasmic adaptor subunit [Desulfuromonadaceae bacterium]